MVYVGIFFDKNRFNRNQNSGSHFLKKGKKKRSEINRNV